MPIKSLILRLVVLIVFISCETKHNPDYNIAKAQAEKIIKTLTQSDLNTYKNWNYSQRDTFGFWHAYSSTTDNGYSCTLGERNDSLFLEVHNPQQFIKDFMLDIAAESPLEKLTLIKSSDSYMVTGEDTSSVRFVLFSKSSLDYPLFKAQNPFDFIRDLDRQKDSLQIVGISSDSNIGNFIEFYLRGPHILTYLPDSLHLNPFSKEIWQRDFERGEKLNKNWNLREP